jgi:hypothetical protein
MIEKTRCITRKPTFLCILCKGYHLTRLCHATVVVREQWSFPGIPLGSESYLVSQHPNPSLVDTMIVSMQSLVDTTLVLGIDVSLDHVVLHPVQPPIMPMQYSSHTTLVSRSDASLDHVSLYPIQSIV